MGSFEERFRGDLMDIFGGIWKESLCCLF